MVAGTGLEPAHLAILVSKTSVSANSTTRPYFKQRYHYTVICILVNS